MAENNVKWAARPIRTHLITDKDDIVEVVVKYTSSIAEPNDIIIVAESPVAISKVEPSYQFSKSSILAKFYVSFPIKTAV